MMSWFGLIPVVLQNDTPPPAGFLGIPNFIWILAIAVIALQVLAFVRRRRQ